HVSTLSLHDALPICTLSVATTDYRTGPDGQRQEFTEWHRVVVWNRQAENCAKYLAKGRTVLIEGRLQTRSWEDKQGQKRYTTEIIANNVQFIGGGRGGERATGGRTSDGEGRGMSDMAMGGMGEPETPGLDDIPF